MWEGELLIFLGVAPAGLTAGGREAEARNM